MKKLLILNPEGASEDEVKEGFEQVWLPCNEALHVLSKNTATSFEGKAYIVPRDITLLKEAKKYLD